MRTIFEYGTEEKNSKINASLRVDFGKSGEYLAADDYKEILEMGKKLKTIVDSR